MALLQRKFEEHQVEFNQLVIRVDTHIIDERRKDLERRKQMEDMIALHRDTNINLAETNKTMQRIDESTRDLAVAWTATKGAIKVGAVIGSFVKWLTGLSVIGVFILWMTKK